MSYKGRHRAPSNTRPQVRRIGTVGLVVAAPFVLATPPASASANTPNEILEVIAQCESGNRNVNNSGGASTASGYLQIINGTWRAYGGTQFASRAIGASRSEQFIVGRNILAGQGIGAWGPSRYCWAKKLGNPPSSTKVTTADTNKSNVVTTVAPPKKRVLTAPTPLPKNKKATTTVTAAKRAAASYVIKRGDTLSKIARSKGTTVRALVNLNRATVKNPDLIYAGASLRLR